MRGWRKNHTIEPSTKKPSTSLKMLQPDGGDGFRSRKPPESLAYQRNNYGLWPFRLDCQLTGATVGTA